MDLGSGEPLAIPGEMALGVDFPSDVQDGEVSEGQVPDASGYRFLVRVQFQLWAHLGPVAGCRPAVGYFDDPVANRRLFAQVEPPFRGFFHAAPDVAGHVFGEELVKAGDDDPHQLAHGSVHHWLHDGDHWYLVFFEQVPVPDHVLDVAGEPVELPHQDGVEGRVAGSCVRDHLLERGPAVHPAGFGFVQVILGDDAAVAGDVLLRCGTLAGDGILDVLLLAGRTAIDRVTGWLVPLGS